MEIDNYNDRCLLTLLNLKEKLSTKDKLFKWFICRGIANPDYEKRAILLNLRSRELLDLDEEPANAYFAKCIRESGFMPDNVQFLIINRAGEKAIYGRIFKSENVRSFNVVVRTTINLVIGIAGLLVGHLFWK